MYNKNIPLFPFGYGLTYTAFKYSGLKIDRKTLSDNEIADITFNIQNTGNYDSDEVVQLYVSYHDSKVKMPANALKGFARVFIRKGETRSVTIPLKADDIAYWDTGRNKWTLEPGRIDLFIGPSSADAMLKGTLTIK